MSLWGKLFKGGESEKKTETERNRQLPRSMVDDIFGEVDLRSNGPENEIFFTILMEPSQEGYQTGVAIDASVSMQTLFGKGLVEIKGMEPPQALLHEYQKKGWLRFEKHKGEKLPVVTIEAKQDLVEKGYFSWTENHVQSTAREFVRYLANTLADVNGTSVIYWACGDGSQLEELGDFTAEQCSDVVFEGPKGLSFGTGTKLLPALRYFVERFPKAERAMYVFITDGELHDLEEVKAYTRKLCHRVASGEMNPVKCVLIGLGTAIDETQMEDLDDLESGTDVDIWDHKIAREMRSLVEIFAEVVSEHQIVAPSARIYDSDGNEVKRFPDGLPAKVSFSMPASSKWFELDVVGRRIRQSVEIEAS